MRKFIAPIAIALLAAAPGAAFAAGAVAPATTAMKPAVTATADQTISGVVKAFDLKAHTLTLDSGIAYMLPADFKDPGLKAGSKVTVKWHMDGKNYDATQVTIG